MDFLIASEALLDISTLSPAKMPDWPGNAFAGLIYWVLLVIFFLVILTGRLRKFYKFGSEWMGDPYSSDVFEALGLSLKTLDDLTD